MHRKCNECGYEHVVCKHCKKLVYESDEDSIDNGYHDHCSRKHFEMMQKKKRAKLHAAGKWARLCAECSEPLIKGHCSYAYENMDGTVDHNSLRCDKCREAEEAYDSEQMANA